MANHRDLVTLAYVLNELEPDGRHRLVERLSPLTADRFSSSSRNTRRLATHPRRTAPADRRRRPCDCAMPACEQIARCSRRTGVISRAGLRPLACAPASQRAPTFPGRTEKFSYVAVSRKPAPAIGARLIARPRKASGRVTLKLCRPDGSARRPIVLAPRRRIVQARLPRRLGFFNVMRRVPDYRRLFFAARLGGLDVFAFAIVDAELRGEIIGKQTKFSRPARDARSFPPKMSSGRSRGSSCRKGPLPVNSFFMFESLPPDPPGYT